MPLNESSAIMFFTFQAASIMIEDLVQRLNDIIGLVKSSVMKRCIGYVWLMAWLVWTFPWWSFVCTMHMKAGKDDLIPLARGTNSQI
jgi:hypothetical protein